LQNSDPVRQGDASRSETRTLIAASKVEGTAVYNRQGESLGSVYDVMIDKRSGDVAYAVMSFGGFLGIGQSYHPVPWDMLDYDERQGGYVVDLTREVLEKAPSYAQGQEPNWGDHTYVRQIDEHYRSSRRSL
jgi:sporulation protein YlmC with PRC-barrel domain